MTAKQPGDGFDTQDVWQKDGKRGGDSRAYDDADRDIANHVRTAKRQRRVELGDKRTLQYHLARIEALDEAQKATIAAQAAEIQALRETG